MWKAVNNTVCLKTPDHLKPKGTITRQYNPKKFIQPSSSGNTYKFSFFARTIRDWNNLSDSVIESESYDVFKRAVYLSISDGV